MAALTFDVWKTKFREDCEAQGKLVQFNCLGDYVLQKLWESGLEPSVQALTASASKPRTVTASDAPRLHP